MAVPTEHKENLRSQLAFHKGRLDSLREQIGFMQREIHVHELVLTPPRQRGGPEGTR